VAPAEGTDAVPSPIEAGSGCVLVYLRGDIDVARRPHFARLIARLRERRPRHAIVDVSGVSFIDCAGYGLLLRTQAAVEGGGGSFILRDPSPAVSRLLGLLRPTGPSRRSGAALAAPVPG
jgi:anti-anti-sigma factor